VKITIQFKRKRGYQITSSLETRQSMWWELRRQHLGMCRRL